MLCVVVPMDKHSGFLRCVAVGREDEGPMAAGERGSGLYATGMLLFFLASHAVLLVACCLWILRWYLHEPLRVPDEPAHANVKQTAALLRISQSFGCIVAAVGAALLGSSTT